MLDSKQLSIIIVNYNSRKFIPACVASIYEKLGLSLSWEIVIVNSDEKENIHKLPLDFSRVEIIDHKNNVGFGAGVNLGASAAKGKYLLFLNPDTEIKDFFSQDIMNNIFSASQSIGIIGGNIVDKSGQTQKWIAGSEVSLKRLIKNNLGWEESQNAWSNLQQKECDWVAGTAMLMEKDLFESLGGFDEKFFMYFEDMDLCRRVRKSGRKVVFFPKFSVVHASGQSYKDKKLQKKHYYESMEYYFKKNRARWEFFIVKLLRRTFFN